MIKIGVYIITNLINGKIYIGSTTESFQLRWSTHKRSLKGNRHCNRHLQFAVNKYGVENFKFEILEECLSEFCVIREQYYLDTLLFAQEYINNKDKRFLELGYNINPLSSSCANRELSDIHKKRIGLRHKDKVLSLESRNKIKIARKSQINTGQIKVIKLSLEGVELEEYNSIGEASKDNNNIGTSNICKCIKGIYKSCAGFKWKYKDENKKRKLKVINKLIKRENDCSDE